MTTATGTCLLEARGVTKVFPGTTALHDVNLCLRAGEVHALIGENGAGKSTLVRILAGVDTPTTGSLIFDGRPVTFRSVREAAGSGIGLIHQELQLFPNLSVAENLFIGRERTTAAGVIDRAGQVAAARAVLARLGQDIDPHALVGTLPLGLQQIVEIARALTAETRVLMMDEPTSALAPAEVRVLFDVIRDLAARGVAIVYISHHLQELMAIADRVTVLRDGSVVGAERVDQIDIPWIVERMTGRRTEPRPHHVPAPAGDAVLDVRDLSLPRAPGRTALDRVSLQLRRGEVLGLFGLLGAGRTELFETILGVHADAEGDVVLDGRPLSALGVSARVAAGLALVPEDRQAAGLVAPLSVEQNMTLSHLSALAPTAVLRPSAERAASAALAATLRIKTPGLDAPVTALSGGNQQKVVIARGVMPRPLVLLLDDPTRGVDVAAKAEILRTMRQLALEGMGVVFATSDTAEILEGADRVLVMTRGRVQAEFSASEATDDLLTRAASAAPEAPGGDPDVRH